MNALVPAVAITPFKLVPGQRITYGSHVYECTERTVAAKKLVRVDTRHEEWVQNRQLIAMMASGQLKLAPHASTPACRAELHEKEFASLPEAVRRRAYMRLAYVEALLENKRLGFPRKAKAVINEVFRQRIAVPGNEGEWEPCEDRTYKWRKIWEQNGCKGVRHLVMAESYRSPRGFKGDDNVQRLLSQAILETYATPQREMVSTVHDAFVGLCTAAGMADKDIHNERTTRRHLSQLSPYAVLRARRGQRAAELAYRSVGKLPVTALPGEVYEVDAHKLDIVIVDDDGMILGRLWITTAIDRCTRMIVGFHLHLEPPSSLTIAACLRNAIAPKLYMLSKWPQIGREWVCWGVPVLVILDNGLENKAEFLIAAADEIGFTIHWAPARTPEYKPHIERWHLTLTNRFERRVPGNTGSSPADRGDYDTAAMACATLADIDEALHQWVVTCYNREPHRGINDVPERKWIDLTGRPGGEVAAFDDIARLDVLLGHIAWRSVHTYGIELLGIRYGDLGANRCLEMLRTRPGAGRLGKVRIRFDPTNLECIQVQDPETLRYYRVDSLDPEYTTGLTLAQHRVIRREAVARTRGYITVNDLCRARDNLRKRMAEIIGDPHSDGRKKAAILAGIGSKGSWGPFYREALDEYGRTREEQMSRSVIDLLEGEYSFVDDAVKPVADATPTPKAATVPVAGTGGAEPVALKPTETGGRPHNELTARASLVGMTLEGLDD